MLISTVSARLTTFFTAFFVALSFLIAAPAWSESQLVTFDELKKIAPTAKTEFLQAIVAAQPEFEAAGINTRMRMAHFIAQVMTETGGLSRLDENMNYSYKTLLRVFSRKTVSDAKAREIAGKPIQVANWVYGARLGNLGRETMDGWNYRGSGFIQLTGRYNFRARGAEIGLDLESDPDMARRELEGLSAAIAYWTARGVNAAADNNDMHRVRVMVNGPAAHGEDQARVWFNRAWTRVFRDKASAGFESGEELASAEADATTEAAIFDDILAESGLVTADELGTESGSETARADALKEFQGELGLPESGVLDDATMDALLDPREWRYQEDDVVAAIAQPQDGDQSVTFDIGAPSSETELAANEGTGALEPSLDLVQSERGFLASAQSAYAAYEMGDLALTEPSTFKPFSVIGEDDRVAITDTTGYPARAIVQILFTSPEGRKLLCSGAMISPDTVLTAAHCLHSGTTSGALNANFTVIPGRNSGIAPFGRCGVKRAFVLSGWTNALTQDDARYYDLGALKLDCSIGKRTGWMGVSMVAESAADLPIVIQGYASDLVPSGRQWRSEDSIRLLWAMKGFHQADTFG
ncbi:MAG: trypsin-like serine protease, partial [Deltaproteobacteria bacterium]